MRKEENFSHFFHFSNSFATFHASLQATNPDQALFFSRLPFEVPIRDRSSGFPPCRIITKITLLFIPFSSGHSRHSIQNPPPGGASGRLDHFGNIVFPALASCWQCFDNSLDSHKTCCCCYCSSDHPRATHSSPTHLWRMNTTALEYLRSIPIQKKKFVINSFLKW